MNFIVEIITATNALLNSLMGYVTGDMSALVVMVIVNLGLIVMLWFHHKAEKRKDDMYQDQLDRKDERIDDLLKNQKDMYDSLKLLLIKSEITKDEFKDMVIENFRTFNEKPKPKPKPKNKKKTK